MAVQFGERVGVPSDPAHLVPAEAQPQAEPALGSGFAFQADRSGGTGQHRGQQVGGRAPQDGGQKAAGGSGPRLDVPPVHGGAPPAGVLPWNRSRAAWARSG